MNRLIAFMTLLTIKIVLIIVLIISFFNLELALYEALRIGVMGGFLVLSFYGTKKKKGWFFIWFISAILVSPMVNTIWKRNVWEMIDIIWIILLLVSILITSKPKKIAQWYDY